MSEENQIEKTQAEENTPEQKTEVNDSEKQSPKRKRLHEKMFEDKPKRKGPKFNIYWIYVIILGALLGSALLGGGLKPELAKLSEQEVKQNMLLQGDIDKIEIVKVKDIVRIYIKPDSIQKPYYEKRFKTKYVPAKVKDVPLFQYEIAEVKDYPEKITSFCKENNIQEPRVIVTTDPEFFGPFSTSLISIIVMVGAMILLMRKMGGGAGGGGSGGIFNIGKSKATLFDKGTKVNITFADVAGLDEAKVEVMEIVDFLKTPEKYTALGGKIPKGALLIGPPGTGKTLLAKAMAGEAQVPFFSLSGSDFVEMFVGVGASRVRDLFKQAREKAPCIIFIDEIDAIGRARGKNAVMSNDERENTLNQLLVEMDGFGGDSGIIILAATNRPDVLDSALLRPGRFDRRVILDIPDRRDREEILEVHSTKKPFGEDVLGLVRPIGLSQLSLSLYRWDRSRRYGRPAHRRRQSASHPEAGCVRSSRQPTLRHP